MHFVQLYSCLFRLFVSDAMVNVKDVLGRWRKRVGEATRKAEDLAGNTWQHCEYYFSLYFSYSIVCCLN